MKNRVKMDVRFQESLNKRAEFSGLLKGKVGHVDLADFGGQ